MKPSSLVPNRVLFFGYCFVWFIGNGPDRNYNYMLVHWFICLVGSFSYFVWLVGSLFWVWLVMQSRPQMGIVTQLLNLFYEQK